MEPSLAHGTASATGADLAPLNMQEVLIQVMRLKIKVKVRRSRGNGGNCGLLASSYSFEDR